MRILGLLSLFILTASCGFEVEKTSGLDVTYVESSSGTPINLKMGVIDRSSCEQEAKSRVKIFAGSRYRTPRFLLDDSLFSSIYMGGSQKLFDSNIGLRSSRTFNTNGTLFSPCGGMDYSLEDTLNSAAASSLYSFKNLFKQRDLLPMGLPLVSLKVGVSVKMVKEVSKSGKLLRQESFMVNNAFYRATKKEIVFLPQGKNVRGEIPFSKVPMWEIPFIGAHEYAHHIFSHLVPNYINDRTRQKVTKLCFDNNSAHSNEFYKNEKGKRKVELSSIFTALNEGFADLFARYITDSKVGLRGISCFEKSRDVESDTFFNGTKKILHSQVVNIFLSTDKKRRANCLQQADFQDPHLIGAIIANTFYSLFEKSNLEKKEKLDTLYRFLKKLNLDYFKLKTMNLNDALESIVYMGIEEIDLSVNLKHSDKCAFVSMHYPALHRYYSCKK